MTLGCRIGLWVALAWAAAPGQVWAAGRAGGPLEQRPISALDARFIREDFLGSSDRAGMPPQLIEVISRLKVDNPRKIQVLRPIFSFKGASVSLGEAVRKAVAEVQGHGAELARAAKEASRSGDVEGLSSAIAGMRQILFTFSAYLPSEQSLEAEIDLPRLKAAYEQAHENHRKLLDKKLKAFIASTTQDLGLNDSKGRPMEDVLLELVGRDVESNRYLNVERLPTEKIRELAAAIHDHNIIERPQRSAGFFFDTGDERVYLYRELRLIPAAPNPRAQRTN